MTLQEVRSSCPPIVLDARPQRQRQKVVVLDDDPTGSQTVNNIAVLTVWSVDDLLRELQAETPGFFVLTNTRSLSPEAAAARNRSVGFALREAGALNGREQSFMVISRGDSTLRGHYPVETDALAESLGGDFDGTVLVPAFMDGGRLTVDDVHYVAERDVLIPVGETEFAKDRSFGFRSSNLRDYVEEKTEGRVRASEVLSVTLADLRLGGAERVAKKLAQLTAGQVGIVNAATREDLYVLSEALAHPSMSGRRLLYRTAADFVAAVLGQYPQPPLAAERLRTGSGGGLVVAGSYVGRTSAQLDVLFAADSKLERIEVEVTRLVDRASRGSEISSCRTKIERTLGAGRSAVVYTSRRLLAGADAAGCLELGSSISSALVEVVVGLRHRPDWLVAKGGITSSDLATEALGIRRALILGQALPGVPVWQCGPESRWPGLPYIVFPGNVGGPEALADLVRSLEAARTFVPAHPSPGMSLA